MGGGRAGARDGRRGVRRGGPGAAGRAGGRGRGRGEARGWDRPGGTAVRPGGRRQRGRGGGGARHRGGGPGGPGGARGGRGGGSVQGRADAGGVRAAQPAEGGAFRSRRGGRDSGGNVAARPRGGVRFRPGALPGGLRRAGAHVRALRRGDQGAHCRRGVTGRPGWARRRVGLRLHRAARGGPGKGAHIRAGQADPPADLQPTPEALFADAPRQPLRPHSHAPLQDAGDE